MLFRLRSLWMACFAVVGLALLFPVFAFAESGAAPNNELVFSTGQFWTALIACVVPAVTYVLNHNAPWADEKTKAFVLLLVSAAVGAVSKLIATGDLTFTTKTFEYIGIAVFFAFAAHAGFYKPSTLSTALGGGRNKPRRR